MCTKIFAALFICLLFYACQDSMSNNDEINWTLGKQMLPAETNYCPDSILSLIFEDAACLALRDVHKIESEKNTLIEIPIDLIQIYYNGLIHVHNTISIPARDSVVSMYSIHVFPHPETHCLIVNVDSTENWVQNWKNGNRLTGNAEVDQLIEKYDLQLDKYYFWPWAHAIILSTPYPQNIFALARSFSNIIGVSLAEPDGHMGDGNDISGSLSINYIKLIYSIGFGDCPSGCIGRHFWTFKVSYDGEVTYLNSYGDPLPYPTGMSNKTM